MEEFKPNSHKYKQGLVAASEDRQKAEKVVSGKVKTRKKTGVQKFADRFISDDAENIKTYVSEDIIIPGIKNMIEDIVTKGIRLLLRGSVGDRRDSRTPASRVSYRDCYDRDNRSNGYIRANARYSYEDVIFDNIQDAKEVLSRMDEVVDTYKMISVADLYEFAGITPSTTDHKYGWTDIRSARIESTRDGYQLRLPKALPLD